MIYITSAEKNVAVASSFFLITLTTLVAFFFICMFKETKFRIKKQTYMLLNILPCHCYIVKINSFVVTCACFAKENNLLSLF